MPVFITFRVHGLLHYWHRSIGINGSREPLECVKAIPRIYIHAHTHTHIYICSRHLYRKSHDIRNCPACAIFPRPIVVSVSTSRILSHPCLVTETFHRRIRFLTAKCNGWDDNDVNDDDDVDDETRIRLVVVHEIAPIERNIYRAWF